MRFRLYHKTFLPPNTIHLRIMARYRVCGKHTDILWAYVYIDPPYHFHARGPIISPPTSAATLM